MVSVIRTLLIISSMSLSSSPAIAQDITYGSNDGKYVEVLGRQIYYEEYGSGTPIFMIHGGPGSIDHFSKVIPVLSQHFTIIAMDSPSQGRSERADSLSYNLLADNAAHFIDKLNIERCYVVGFSDGAVTALKLAALRPDKVVKVFASGGFSKLDGFTEEDKTLWTTITPEKVEKQWGGWHKEYQNLLHPSNDWKKLIYDIRDMVKDEIYIRDEELDDIECGVLLAFGDRDAITLDHALSLYRSIKKSQLLVVPNTSHMTFDEQPEIMSQAIINFFRENR